MCAISGHHFFLSLPKPEQHKTYRTPLSVRDSVFARRPELVPNGQSDQGKSCRCNSLYEVYHNIAGLGFFKSPGKLCCLLLFYHVRKVLMTQVQIFQWCPDKLPNPSAVLVMSFSKISWQTREQPGALAVQAWVGLLTSRVGFVTRQVRHQQQWAGLLLQRWGGWHRNHQWAPAVLPSQLLLDAAVPHPWKCSYWDSSASRVQSSFGSNLESILHFD